MTAHDPDAPSTSAEVVAQFIGHLERKDLDAACALVTADCEYDNVPIGKVHGPEGIRQILEGFVAGFGRIEWQVLHQVSRDDGPGSGVVMNERLDRFERLDPGSGWMELPVAGLFVVAAGRIALWRDYFDQGTLMAQMAPS